MTADERRGRRWLADNLRCGDETLDRLARLAAALREENERQNLVAAASVAELWWRHIVDSAQLLLVSRRHGESPSRLRHGTGSGQANAEGGVEVDPPPRRPASGRGVWLDLGTGAGFPGLVVAIVEPAQRMVLVEERRRRIAWLERIAGELDLPNVEIAGSALDKVKSFDAEVISARAFAPLPKLLHGAARFSTGETVWLLPKGEKGRQEVAELPKKLRAMFHVEPSVTSEQAGIVVGRGAVGIGRDRPPC